MQINWSVRLDREPRLRQLAEWPYVDVSNLHKSKRKRFIRNQQIALSVLKGVSIKHTATVHQVSTSFVSHILNRCLSGDENEPPPLTQGLIPDKRLNKGERRQPMDMTSGQNYSFQWLLNHVPYMESRLDSMIKAYQSDKPYSQNLTPKVFHGEFKNVLREANHPTDCYPYNTQSVAYESVRQYLHKRSNELKRIHDQKAHKYISDLPAQRALRTIQIDEQTMDLHTSIHLQLNEELIPLRIKRINLLLAMDVDTNCKLGFAIAYTKTPNQQDILMLFDKCIKPWQPLQLTTPGFQYEPGAMFPSGHPAITDINFNTLQLDNALSHFSHSVRDVICIQRSATLSFGPPAVPQTRNWIEAAFNYININFSHRANSTTGSHPKDPKKESRKNNKKVPLITLRTLEEALSIILTQDNVTPKSHLGATTPLSLFLDHHQNHYVRYTPEILRERWSPFTRRVNLPIKWLKKENRQPHVNFFYVRYTSSHQELYTALRDDSYVTVEYDIRDIRELSVFTTGGAALGTLLASRSWRRFKHSLATRKHIHNLVKAHAFHATDLLAGYFRYLLEHKGNSEDNLKILKIYDEFTDSGDEPLILKPSQDHSYDAIAVDQTTLKIKPWSTSLSTKLMVSNHATKH
ncbi:MAG: putative transposase [Pseudomonadales bacterium]|jgi:putative transposase